MNNSGVYRKIKLKLDYIGKKIESEQNGNGAIAESLRSKEPFMCVRLGAVEARCVDKWMRNKEFTSDNMDSITYAAGVFPQNEKTVESFCKIYTDAIKQTDLMGVWSVLSEKNIIKKYCPHAHLIPSRSIEPYYYKEPWSKELSHKRVLVIHPFVESIDNQYKKRDNLFDSREILPEFKELILIKAVQSNAGGESDFLDWFEALDYMKSEIDKVEFDVAIIGAGAYGLPLAAYIKLKGKQAIQMAGSTQILFGIKGKRWDNHPIISKLYNKYWIRPNQKETPPRIDKVEGGSYW